jgi:hypothetical protein
MGAVWLMAEIREPADSALPVPSSAGRWGGLWLPATALVALLFYLLLGALSASLGRIEVSDLPTRSLAGLHTTFGKADAVSQARQAWCLWNSYQQRSVVVAPAAAIGATASTGAGYGQQLNSRAASCVKAFENGGTPTAAGGDGTGGRLVQVYVVLDLLEVALFVGLGLGLVLARRRTLRAGDEIDRGLRKATGAGPLALLFGGLICAELAQAAAQWILGMPSASRRLVDAAGDTLAYAPSRRMLFLGVLVLLLAVLLLRELAELRPEALAPGRGQEPAPGEEPPSTPAPVSTGPQPGLALTSRARRRGRNLRRTAGLLRIQIGVVVIFSLLMSGVGQNEMSDALLRWGDLDGDLVARLLGLATVVAGLVGLSLLSLLLWRSAHRAALTDETPRLPVPPMLLAAIALICLVLALVWPRWPNLGGLGITLAVVTLLSTFSGAPFWRWGREPLDAAGYAEAKAAATARAAMVEPELAELVRRLARWLAAVPVAVVGLALIRSALPPLVVRGTLGGVAVRFLVVIGLGAALLVLAVRVPGLLARADRRNADPADDKPGVQALYLVLAGCAAVAYLLAILPFTRQAVPVLTGPVAVIALFLAAVLVVGNELQRLAELSVPVAGVRVFGARRNPVLAGILVWFILGSLLDATGPHAVRTIDTATAVPRIGIPQAFSAWAKANCALGTSATGTPATGVPVPAATTAGDLPMVFVAAQGGGIRAAYWTAAVLESVFPSTASTSTGSCDQARDHVFALSGASGGSVGIAFWLNSPAAQRPWYQRVTSGTGPPAWYDTALAVDHLSALGSWMLYVDAPRSLLGFRGPDRAALLEQSWEASQPQLRTGFLASYASASDGAVGAAAAGQGSAPWRPLALINGTAVESGCRALTAPVHLTGLDDPAIPGSLSCRQLPNNTQSTQTDATGLYDLTRLFLCPTQDVAQSTAALLSARFPYVTPSGQVTRCGQANAHSYVVDGGYLDNSADLTATDLYLQVQPLIAEHNALVARCAGVGGCPKVPAADRPTRQIKPILVQLDNGYPDVAQGADVSRPGELSVPPRARLAVAGAVEQGARQRAVEVFGSAGYLQVAPAPHPGVEAPLGWVMSDSARDDLCQQLQTVDLRRLASAAGAGSPAPRC